MALPRIRQMGRALGFALGLTAGSAAAQGRTFVAEGSDTVMGVGARHLGMGSTGTATADDAYAVFYNAALLADIDRFTLTGTRQLDARLRPYTFVGAALPLGFLDELGFDATLGVARYNRVHARSSGAFGAAEPESIFLRYLLPGISGTFDGDIDSKTLVNRFALGVAHESLPGLRFGVNVDWIDCKTNSCGVHSGSVGYEVASVHATALSYGFSAAYSPTDRLTLGASFTDVDTTLKVRSIVTDAAGTSNRLDHAALPRQLRLEAAYRWSDRWLFAAGYQKFWGRYGSYSLNYETAHAGAEFRQNDWLTWRAGAWAPIVIESSQGLNFSFPLGLPTIPVPTAGMGITWRDLQIDLGTYVNPFMTLHERFPVVSADLTLSYRF